MELTEVTVRPPSGLLGQRFGRLVVEAMTTKYSGSERLYECRCDCGNVSYATRSGLKANHSRRRVSCGCQKAENISRTKKAHPNFRSLVGQRFSRLRVISIDNAPSDNSRGARYVCWCDCGQVKKVRASELRRGCTKSCGCLAREIHSAWMKELTERQRKNRVAAKDFRKVIGAEK
jgi:hypothetical protein